MAASAILTLNAGSSSLKFALFTLTGDGDPARMVHGEVDGIGRAARFAATDASGHQLPAPDLAAASHEAVVAALLPWVTTHLGGHVLAAVGHRVVHGGRALAAPALVDGKLMAAMEALIPLAPLHQPHCLAALRAVAAANPGLRQVACFDTAFHRTMPAVARRFALPRALEDEGVERYGFHGLSYAFIAGRLRELAPELAAGRVVVAHLGSGASLCALRNGSSVDTTMGMTALDGLPMGTRCGAVDPGVLLWLLKEKRLSPEALEDMLYHRSGLLGVSGESADMRMLEASGSQAAAETMELFAYQVARQACAMAGSLGGMDGLVFTGGIGAHSAGLRRKVCARLGWLGLELDDGAAAGCIGTPASRVAVWAMTTDEEVVIARQTALAAGLPCGS